MASTLRLARSALGSHFVSFTVYMTHLFCMHKPATSSVVRITLEPLEVTTSTLLLTFSALEGHSLHIITNL
jgi:hypothetical protein